MINAIQNLVKHESTIEANFAENYAGIYKPAFALAKKRISYREAQKGVKGNQQMMLAWDIKNGIRNKTGAFILWPAKSEQANKTYLSNLEKLAAMPEKELLAVQKKVGGYTIGTICKNISNANTASKKASQPANGKKTSQPEKTEKAQETKSAVLTVINSYLANEKNKTNANFAAMLIALATAAEKDFAGNLEARAIRAFLENPAMLKKSA